MRLWVFLLTILLCGFSAVVQGRADEAALFVRYREEARRIAYSLDDSALAAQVLLTGIDGKVSLVPAMRTLLERIPPGGIMLFKYNLDSPKDDVKKLLAEVSGLVSGVSGIPPFMAVDHEGGLVHRFGAGVERLPSAFSFWELAQREGRDAAIQRAETLYRLSAEEIGELGINMVLGPVAEILNDDNRVFLDTRSYGRSPDFTQAAARSFVESMSAFGIVSVLKHFPGNSAADPHSGASVINAGKAGLDEMAAPFAGIISALRPGAVMVSHVIVPAIDGEHNASLSGKVIGTWLRGELGFDGIVLADDFSMAAVAASGLSPEAAALEALNQGVDMLMTWPRNISAVHSAIVEALRSGRLSRSRLLEAAERIIAEKIRRGIIKAGDPLALSNNAGGLN